VADNWNKKRRQYGIYRSEKSSSGLGEKWSTISLKEVMSNSRKELAPLTYRDRLQLAVVISSSVLQIHQTPWLSQNLRSEDLVFIQRDNAPLYGHVFIAKRVPDRLCTRAEYSAKATPFGHNPAMLSLGILLIELILGKPIHGTGSATVPDNDFLADYATAQKLLNEVDQFGGPNYGSAVRRCFDNCWFRHTYSFEDEKLRDDIYCGVVAPLEEDLANALG